MTEKDYIDIKEEYLNLVKGMLVETGGLQPSITILGTHKEDQKNSVIHVPIPGKFVESEIMKDAFIDVIVPEISVKINKKFDVKAVAWASEAWLRSAEKDKPDALENWKDLPIKMEVLIVTIESADKNETIILEIVRKGKQVNEDGDLIDIIELVESPEYKQGVTGEGRFTGLYKKFQS
jgi:uncharacterized membrane protein YvbJ